MRDGGNAFDAAVATAAALKRGGNTVNLVKSIEFQETKAPRQLDAAHLLDNLTPWQRETLATAVAEGYYQTISARHLLRPLQTISVSEEQQHGNTSAEVNRE